MAKEFIKHHGLGDYVIQPIGHGVGVEVHEAPYFSLDSQDEIVVNMVVAMEPGLFIPGWGGIRLEETICIHPSGAKTMATHPIDEIPLLE